MPNDLPVSQDIILKAKAQLIAQLFKMTTNETPQIIDMGTYLQVRFTDEQKTIIHKYFEGVLQAKPGKIRIPWGELTLPPIFKVYGRWLIMVLIISFLLGKIIGR